MSLIALALGLSACGGSGKPDPLKKPQYVAQANAICRKAEGERKTVGKEVVKQGGGSSKSEAKELVQRLLVPVHKMTEELAGLGPPVREEKQAAAIVRAFEGGIAKLEAEPAGRATASAFAKADELAEGYGLTDCRI